MLIICMRCNKVYGCRPTYHYPDNLMFTPCQSCIVWQYCTCIGAELYDLQDNAEFNILGYCPDCPREDGVL